MSMQITDSRSQISRSLGIGVLLLAHSAAAQTLAIRADRIVTISHGVMRNGVIVVRDGRITALGPHVKIPRGAQMLAAPLVMPGLIDAHSHAGGYNDADEPVDALTPELRAADAFDGNHLLVTRARASGVTLMAIAPGNSNVFAGQCGLVRLEPTPRVINQTCAQKFSISTDATNPQRNPTSRAGLMDLARGALSAARTGAALSSTSQPDRLLGIPATLGLRVDALRAVLDRRVPAWLHAPTTDDAALALELIAEFGLRGVLLHANEAAPLTARLRERKVPVIVGPLRFGDSERVLANPGRLAAAGVKVAFCSDAPLSDPASLRLTAHLAVKRGLTPDQALRALTLSAAEILGVDRRTGSLEVGKDADLLLLSGDPLNLTSQVLTVVVAGKVVK